MDTHRILNALLLIGVIILFWMRYRASRKVVLSDNSKPKPAFREALFGDMPLSKWRGDEATPPWSYFAEARQHLEAKRQDEAVIALRKVIDTPFLESRHYLQAWHFLRKWGYKPSAEQALQVLGVVVEVPVQADLDIVAAYPDCTARYYNYSGAGVVWERPDTSLDADIDRLISAAEKTVRQMGPWEGPRPGPPPGNSARLTFLTPGGMCFGQGPLEVLAADQRGVEVISAATMLMFALIEKTQNGEARRDATRESVGTQWLGKSPARTIPKP